MQAATEKYLITRVKITENLEEGCNSIHLARWKT